MAVVSSKGRRNKLLLSASRGMNTSFYPRVLKYIKWLTLVCGVLMWLLWCLRFLRQPESVSSGVGNVVKLSPDSLLDQPKRSTGMLPPAFKQVLQRAKENRIHCEQEKLESLEEEDFEFLNIANMTTARLRQNGIIQALDAWRLNPVIPSSIAHGASDIECKLPPENECEETQFTVIFMAYNPDRLKPTLRQMSKMLKGNWESIVREIVLVWNGPREIHESDDGKRMLQFAAENPLRIVYPLKAGLPNDLFNRYHPDIVKVSTKAILYYDDDGPFYSFEAVLGGFELWKRNSRAQIGAMARNIILGSRQFDEKTKMAKGLNDRYFVSHCHTDDVEYNFRYFANFGANMVLPSGSFLHSNYLCYLWHPAIESIREFIRAHPVHPDDITVSTIVSQLGGRAPRVYSRRINMENVNQEENPRRRLMFNINWDANHNMDNSKEKWAQLRSGAINSLTRYFGSINSGSIGWCNGTEFHKVTRDGHTCSPEMARFGKLPWMNSDHTPKATCP